VREPQPPADLEAATEGGIPGAADDLAGGPVEQQILALRRLAAVAAVDRDHHGGASRCGQAHGEPSPFGRPGDGGIDGTIRDDALGLDMVYSQAKRYGDGNSVGVGDLHRFAGATDAAGTTKGVFVATSSFTDPAKDFVKLSPKRIILIDGPELARLMVRHGIRVRTRVRHEVKWVDEDCFDQEAL